MPSALLVLALALSPDDAVVRSEFIFESAPFPSCHASTIAETESVLVAAWFGGKHEKAPDVGIWSSRLVGETWTAPVEIADGVQADGKRYPCWNPVLFTSKDGTITLFYKVGPDPEKWWGMARTSKDGGKTWSTSEKLPDGILGPIKNKPVALKDGSILAPSSFENDRDEWRIHFERFDGKTWTRTPDIAAEKGTIDAIQPSILIHRGDRLQAVGRTRSKRVFSVWSDDLGKTWGKMTLLDLPNPNSGTDAVTLADGRHLLVFNPTVVGRTPLSLAVSADGLTWKTVVELENSPGELSYPAVIQAKDGLIHVVYTWKRQRIRHIVLDPSKLKS